ncbi:MAG: MarR family transcriptional regulator [Fusobacteriaceae bacterium]|nr:MarR family transcriptional regulator [Fusobacteriaceae bacterium]MBP6323066.1 MarR family transcriptional regulator [Fusobacteriaceae bacterium]MBP9510026.1 MarR family transcriptional regulator [Fusobacteriaceae bacterium]
MKTVNHVNEVLEDFFKLFYKTEDLALKVGIKGLTHTELHIIEAIGTGSLTMHELSEKLGTTMGTVTVAATKLAEKNFILRNRSESDRRKVYVSLDKKGIEALNYHENYHNMLLSSITENIPKDELNFFINTFEKILENLNKKTEFFKPLSLENFKENTKISIVAIKGTPIIVDFFHSKGVKNFSTITILETGSTIKFSTESGEIITIDALDAKNLIGTMI